ncbi:MAG: gliding motility-associated C-terminal domain-containing protein [Bacteroidetes bacterium]|nr:gliding motility-associated C-terminal domain-containing protein [Bacteroidota bacterium]
MNKYCLSILILLLSIFSAHAGHASNAGAANNLLFTPCVTVIPISNIITCDGSNVPLTAFASSPAGATYTWTNSDPSIGLAANGIGDIPAFTATCIGLTPIIATITVTPTLGACIGAITTFNFIVKPRPTITGGMPSTQTVCPGNVVPASTLTSNLVATTYTWSNTNINIGLGAGSTGNTTAFGAANPGLVNISGTITITPTNSGCVGSSLNFTVTVKPKPSITNFSNQSYCKGVAVPASAFVSSPPGATYSWTNVFTYSVGLGASGSGDLPAFTTTNAMAFPINAAITVLPTLNGCTGNGANFTITVLADPTVTPISNKSVCNGAISPIVPVTSVNTGTVFSWTNSNPAIGLAANGVGDVSSFAAVNNTAANIVSTITITPSNGLCSGILSSFTITVKPSPTIAAPVNQITCPGNIVASPVLVSNPVGASYSWVNDNTTIGLASNASGNVPAFMTQNLGLTSISGNVTITPTLNSCVGSAVSYSITVKPKPVVVGTSNQTYCIGDNVPASNWISNPPGATYTWTNVYTYFMGLVASGVGNLPAYTTVNGSTFPITSNISVTPTLNGCAGIASNYNISVMNKVTMNIIANQSICEGSLVAAPAYTSPYSGVTYAWANNNTAIGIGASGIGNINSFTATNSTNSAIIGNITVTPAYNGCPGTATVYSVTVKGRITASVPSNQLLCDGTPVAATNFTSSPAGASFSWTNDNTSIGLGASGSGNIPAFTSTNAGTTPILGNITVIPTLAGCVGIASTYTISLNASPVVVLPANQSICSGVNSPLLNFTSVPAGATFAWTNSNAAIGLASSGSGAIPAFLASNPGSSNSAGTISVSATLNGCTGTPGTYSITVKPLPVVSGLSNQIVCTGANVASSAFSSSPAGASFSWTNSNSSIGLGASGTGNLPPFVASNSTNAYLNATITVTPTQNGCVGTSDTYSLSVAPTASVSAPLNQSVCAGTLIPINNIVSSPAGTNYTWTNNNTAIGLAVNGIGDVPSFTALNTGTVPEISTITITPDFGGCNGTAVSYTITVNPLPTVSTPVNQIACPGGSIPAANFTSVPPGASFSWTNTNSTIGLSGNGLGNITAFSALNISSSASIATISVTPSLNTCVGTASNYTITVNPNPELTPVSNQILCNGAVVAASTFSSVPLGASFSWTNSNSTIGLAANGIGDTPGFVTVNAGASASVASISVTPTLNGCTGAPFNYSITVNPTPVAPLATGITECPNTAVNLSASAPAGTIEWYDLAVGGTLLSSGPNFTTPLLAASTNYFVQASINTCKSSRTLVPVTISNVMTVNAGLPDTICEGTVAQLQANPQGAAYTYVWDAPGNAGFSNLSNPAVAPLSTTTYTVTVSKTGGCVGTSTVKINVTAKPILLPLSNVSVCSGSNSTASSFTSIPPGASYVWTNSDISIGLASNGIGNVPSFSAINFGSSAVLANINVLPSLNGCNGTALNYVISVEPKPTVSIPLSSSYCVGTLVPATNFVSTPLGASFSWTNTENGIGMGLSGNGNIPAFTTTNGGNSDLTGTINVTPTLNGCVGSPSNYNIIVKATPQAIAPVTQTACAGSNFLPVNFSSIPAGASYLWTNTNTAIGLAANGAGNISSFPATNAGTTILQSTISITPTLNGCIGSSTNFLMEVNPQPALIGTTNQTVCDGAIFSASNFSSTPSGASYSWTNSNPSIGLAPSGTGNTPLFTASNSSSALISGVVTVTPVLNGCAGATSNFTLSVKPKPVVVLPAALSICNGENSAPIVLSSNPIGASITWQNSNPGIGLSANGIGNIPSFIASNSGSSLASATVLVTPTLNACVGVTQNFAIDVKPTPVAPTVANATVCVNTSAQLTATAPGGNYEWYSASSGGSPLFTGVSYSTPTLTTNTIYFVQTNMGGCVSARTQVNAFITGFFVASAGPDDSICSGANYTLQASPNLPGYSCIWDEPSNPGFSNNFITTITPGLSKIYIAKITGPGGCVVSDTVFIKVNPVPVVTPPSGLSICNGASTLPINFNAFPISSVCTWTNSNQAIGLIAAGSGNISAFVATNSTQSNISASISVQPSYHGCVGITNNFSIVVKPTPQITSILLDLQVCSGELVPANTISVTPASSNISWTNSNTSIGLSSSGSTNMPSFIADNNTGSTQSGLLKFTPTFQGCLGNAITYNVFVNASPLADFTFSPETPSLINPLVHFNQSSQYAQSYVWDFGDGFTSTETSPVHSYQDTGCFTTQLIAENVNGCKDTLQQLVCVESTFTLYIPNAFTPDGDDRNDTFLPVGFGISEKNYELIIFDRLGDEIFRSNDLAVGWNGKGEGLFSKGDYGVNGYIYKISCRDLEGNNHNYVGQVLLIR